MDRVAQGGTVTLTAIYQTGVGDLVDPVNPTIDIIDANGLELVTDGVPTRTSLGNFSYAYVVPADGPIGIWHAHWGGTVDGAAGGGDDWFNVVLPADLIAASYVSVAQLRALPNLADVNKFTDAELTAATLWFEAVFEDYTGVAWIPRTVIGERHHGTGDILFLDHLFPRSISAIRVYTDAATTVAYTAAEMADVRLEPSGIIRRRSGATFGYGAVGADYTYSYDGLGWFSSVDGLVAVDYTHGFDEPPADVVEAAKVAIRDHLIVDYQANRQYAVSTEAGIVRTSTPDIASFSVRSGSHAGRPFGIPEVDVVANRRNHRCPSVA